MNTNQELILRIKSSLGMSRITINKAATFGDLHAEVINEFFRNLYC